jgi:hypothetical protein
MVRFEDEFIGPSFLQERTVTGDTFLAMMEIIT